MYYAVDNGFDAEGIKSIAALMNESNSLAVLNLCNSPFHIAYNNIGEEGARMLAQALRHNTSVTVLYLSTSF